ncbi:MAG: UDP-N-acetylmuramate dehydrogenase, partial [Candidatus Peregrinibacteria bacterium]|nr:UDP-N-acetylmuramate dehydrogenase [Candidatus Peregrinibacteria bacterium]
GKNLQNLIEESAKEGFTDLTNLAGIPGTLGGAVRGNAGAYGSEISEFIVEIEYVNELGNIEKISPQKAEFDYRTSIFKQNPDWAITSATLKLTQKENPETALEKIKNLTKERWQKIPAGKSGGSFFKNPTNNSAGKLLDELGAKGDQLGEIQIAQNHANFFLNTGNGKQNDLIELARKWKHKVSEKHNISLEPEVILVDEFGEIVKL